MKNQLIVVIDYEKPPRAEDIGALFSALAKDYKTVSRGRVLVIASIDHGSIIATLVDWAFQALPYVKASVETAKGAKALADFGRLLKDSVTAVKSPNFAKSLPPSSGRRSVHRTMRAMAKTAAENHCDIRIKHIEADGETLEVEMTARQAVEAQRVLEAPRTVQEHAAIARPAQIPELPAVHEAIGRLYAAGAQAYSATEAQTVADALIEVLQTMGLIEIVARLVADLRQKGSHTLAEALEARLNERRGKHGPPLATT